MALTYHIYNTRASIAVLYFIASLVTRIAVPERQDSFFMSSINFIVFIVPRSWTCIKWILLDPSGIGMFRSIAHQYFYSPLVEYHRYSIFPIFRERSYSLRNNNLPSSSRLLKPSSSPRILDAATRASKIDLGDAEDVDARVIIQLSPRQFSPGLNE